ncbi:alpha-amylase family glycosyl hydrolase [Mucilaginibacter sp. CSA2-8R]|uniref:alpha-amylase family glycosyl hydrolase n=1 Tax=Mucilaginibacter sp. CSA2-8R TaxID=3141542 RepID=UPI00315DD241
MQREVPSWTSDAVFYHIYPLGLVGAPMANDFKSDPVERMAVLNDWIPHIKQLGCNALYLGPVFESDFHGYDTADYYLVDRRLGTNQTLKNLSQNLHHHGIKLVVDTVFNHVGRNFPPFKDLQLYGDASIYKDWFVGVDFTRHSTYGDKFYYEGWFDAYNLVKLNLRNPEVINYLLHVVAFWMDEFNIDGLRLDVAEIMDKDFLAALSVFCRNRKSEFWLMGEVIEGDYREWANTNMLDSTTNYEAYKGLYSSHNDKNYFEIAHSLNRQFGHHGVYQDLFLYNFADNHDTTRIASILNDVRAIYPLHAILFTMPGIPAIYYGSEWGIEAIKGAHDDTMLRPAVDVIPDVSNLPLYHFIKQLIAIRHQQPVLQKGIYKQLHVSNEQLVFSRETQDASIIIAVSQSEQQVDIGVHMEIQAGVEFKDLLSPQYQIFSSHNYLFINDVQPFGIRILLCVSQTR